MILFLSSLPKSLPVLLPFNLSDNLTFYKFSSYWPVLSTFFCWRSIVATMVVMLVAETLNLSVRSSICSSSRLSHLFIPLDLLFVIQRKRKICTHKADSLSNWTRALSDYHSSVPASFELATKKTSFPFFFSIRSLKRDQQIRGKNTAFSSHLRNNLSFGVPKWTSIDRKFKTRVLLLSYRC